MAPTRQLELLVSDAASSWAAQNLDEQRHAQRCRDAYCAAHAHCDYDGRDQGDGDAMRALHAAGLLGGGAHGGPPVVKPGVWLVEAARRASGRGRQAYTRQRRLPAR